VRVIFNSHRDEKLIRFALGKANMEPLSVANRRGYVHPVFLGAWFALSTVMTQYMNWWPSQGYGFLRWFAPLPAFASMAVPFMFLIDWFNRNDVEERAHEVLRRPDSFDFVNYYSGAPGSGLWIIEYGERFVGFVAIDAKKDGKDARQTTEAHVRHFFIDEPYRCTGIQDDLLAYAIRYTFNAQSSIDTIKAEGNPLVSYVEKALRSAGFVQGNKIGSMGLFKWQLYEMVLSRTQWKEKK